MARDAADKAFILAESRDIPIKWRLGAVCATADPDILRRLINTSSIMVGNAASIMQREAGRLTSG